MSAPNHAVGAEAALTGSSDRREPDDVGSPVPASNDLLAFHKWLVVCVLAVVLALLVVKAVNRAPDWVRAETTFGVAVRTTLFSFGLAVVFVWRSRLRWEWRGLLIAVTASLGVVTATALALKGTVYNFWGYSGDQGLYLAHVLRYSTSWRSEE